MARLAGAWQGVGCLRAELADRPGQVVYPYPCAPTLCPSPIPALSPIPEAGYRSGNQSDLLVALLRLAGVLGTFPLPRGSAQGEMVGRKVAQTMDLELRKQVGGWVGGRLCVCVCELTGAARRWRPGMLDGTVAAAVPIRHAPP